MRVAIVSNTAWYLFNFRLNLMLALRDAGWSVVAIAPEDEWANKIRAAGFLFFGVPISGGGVNPFSEAQSILSIRSVLVSQNVDVLCSYTPKGNLYSAVAAIFTGVPFFPNISGLGRSFIKESILTSFVKVLYKSTLGRARRVFFQNQDDLELFVKLKLVARDRVERLPGSGVDLRRFTLGEPSKRAGDKAVFLLIARMLWDKGVGEFVEAARSVKAKYPNVRFQLLGFSGVANPSAISREKLSEWVQEGVVEYLGHSDDVRPFLSNADCVVLPSYREGVPRTLLEAAAVGKVIVTTDAPGCRDTVIDGKSGVLCRVADSNDLAEKIQGVIELPLEARNEMGRVGRRYMEEKFDERIVLDRYLCTLKEFDVV